MRLTSFIGNFMVQTVAGVLCGEPGFYVPAHRNTMPQINTIPHPITLN